MSKRMPRGSRPTVTAFTTLPVTFYGDDGAAVEDRARFAVLVVNVKSGSARALATFYHFAGRYGLEWLAEEDTHTPGAYAPDSAPELNATVTTPFRVWGLPEALLSFVEANTGAKRCLDSWYQPVTVRVASSAGSGAIDDTCRKRIREMQRPREEREAREERARLNRLPHTSEDSPYYAERKRLARFKAEQFLQAMWDTSMMREEELSEKTDRLAQFYAKFDRPPTSAEELYEETGPK